jgi:hypothetical protein
MSLTDVLAPVGPLLVCPGARLPPALTVWGRAPEAF